MAKNPKQTGKKAASAASKVLRSGSTSKASKRAAGSALAQAPYKKRKYVFWNKNHRYISSEPPSEKRINLKFPE